MGGNFELWTFIHDSMSLPPPPPHTHTHTHTLTHAATVAYVPTSHGHSLLHDCSEHSSPGCGPSCHTLLLSQVRGRGVRWSPQECKDMEYVGATRTVLLQCRCQQCWVAYGSKLNIQYTSRIIVKSIP